MNELKKMVKDIERNSWDKDIFSHDFYPIKLISLMYGPDDGTNVPNLVLKVGDTGSVFMTSAGGIGDVIDDLIEDLEELKWRSKAYFEEAREKDQIMIASKDDVKSD